MKHIRTTVLLVFAIALVSVSVSAAPLANDGGSQAGSRSFPNGVVARSGGDLLEIRQNAAPPGPGWHEEPPPPGRGPLSSFRDFVKRVGGYFCDEYIGNVNGKNRIIEKVCRYMGYRGTWPSLLRSLSEHPGGFPGMPQQHHNPPSGSPSPHFGGMPGPQQNHDAYGSPHSGSPSPHFGGGGDNQHPGYGEDQLPGQHY